MEGCTYGNIFVKETYLEALNELIFDRDNAVKGLWCVENGVVTVRDEEGWEDRVDTKLQRDFTAGSMGRIIGIVERVSTCERFSLLKGYDEKAMKMTLTLHEELVRQGLWDERAEGCPPRVQIVRRLLGEQAPGEWVWKVLCAGAARDRVLERNR